MIEIENVTNKTCSEDQMNILFCFPFVQYQSNDKHMAKENRDQHRLYPILRPVFSKADIEKITN